MRSRLIGTICATAALSSCLSVAAMQVLATSPAAATTSSSVQAPTETELLQQIADNTATTNSELTKINTNVKSALKDDGKVSVNTANTALRLKVVNTNLVALHTQLKSYFEFQDVAKSNYTGNEMRLIEVTLCSIDQTLNDGVVSHIAPCGN